MQELLIHPINPQARLIEQAALSLRKGGIIIYPTSCAYVLGCHLGDHEAAERLRAIRQVDKQHFFTLICRNLSEIATYATVENWVFRLLKANTPGDYTFVLRASQAVPKKMLQEKRKTIGIRVPSNPIAQALLEELNEPILSTTLIMPGEAEPLADPYEITDRLNGLVDVFINAGDGGRQATTVIDLSRDKPYVIREGKGCVAPFQM
jgi:tRNA threonylcarbamoyl adenosine modification protein (Sua5/YciO/YrdC/YwlC family)